MAIVSSALFPRAQPASAPVTARTGPKVFPLLPTALQKLKAKSAVLDMEAVVVDAEGKTSFQALQAALGAAGDPREIIGYVFDLLHLDGKNLTKLPLIERKEKLHGLLKRSNQQMTLRYSDHIIGHGAAGVRQGLRRGPGRNCV